jgi:uncharacterized membrane protein required for colicin V production
VNALDIIILAVVALCAIAGYHKGLIRTVYRLVSFLAAIFIALRLYTFVARILRQTALFPAIKNGISRTVNLEGVGAEIIDNLPIPGVFQTLLHSYNTPNMFELLQVETVEEYIAGFFANMAINGIAILALFVLTMFALIFVGYALDIVSKLPVINFLNRIGGFVFGIAISCIIIWLVLVTAALFAAAYHPFIYNLLDGSWVTQRLFELTLPQLATVS